eukprot:COSAG05_NODE_301_length_11860_cov_30.927812_3_plen_348_part_00
MTIVSNCDATNWRRQLIAALGQWIPVDNIAKCDHNHGWPFHNTCDPRYRENGTRTPGVPFRTISGAQDVRDGASTAVTPAECLQNDRVGDVLRRYRFYLAFENTCEPGYITEKVYNALDAGAIPVYLGAPDVELYVPKGSIMDAREMAREEYDALVKMKKQGYLLSSRAARKHVANMAKILGQAMAAILAEDDKNNGIVGGVNVERLERYQNSALHSKQPNTLPVPLSGDAYMEWRKKYPTREACDAAVDCMGRFAGFSRHDSDCRVCSYAYALIHEERASGDSTRGPSTGWFGMGKSPATSSAISSAVRTGHATNGPMEVPVLTPSGQKALWTHASQRLVQVKGDN